MAAQFLGYLSVLVGLLICPIANAQPFDSTKYIEDALKFEKKLAPSIKGESFLCEVSGSKSILMKWDEDESLRISEITDNVKGPGEKVYVSATVVEQNGNFLIYDQANMVAMVQPRIWKWFYVTLFESLDFADVIGQKLSCEKL